MVMFNGEYRHNLDAKNRLIIPSRFRSQITGILHVTEWFEGCLAAFDEPEWNELNEKLAKLPFTDKKARALTRLINGKAIECEIDGQGRILLPQFQLKDAGFDKACALVGASGHFEIWPEQKYDEYMDRSAVSLEDIAEDLTDLLS